MHGLSWVKLFWEDLWIAFINVSSINMLISVLFYCKYYLWFILIWPSSGILTPYWKLHFFFRKNPKRVGNRSIVAFFFLLGLLSSSSWILSLLSLPCSKFNIDQLLGYCYLLLFIFVSYNVFHKYYFFKAPLQLSSHSILSKQFCEYNRANSMSVLWKMQPSAEVKYLTMLIQMISETSRTHSQFSWRQQCYHCF